MSDSQRNTQTARQLAAKRFGQDLDPLSEHASTFEEIEQDAGFDAFDLVRENVYDPAALSERTRESYETAIGQWRNFMQEVGRHPACPSDEHVRQFDQHLRTKTRRPCSPATVKEKLIVLNRIFEYWQSDPALPHDDDFNPFELVLKEGGFSSEGAKEIPRVELRELREICRGIKHIRDRAIVASNLKLGIRATEACNIKLSHIALENEQLRRHYSELGTSERVKDYENAIVIPHDIEGNKSKRPRVLPLDDEMRRVFQNWLLIRPDCGEPYLFISETGHAQLGREAINNAWQRWLPAKYTKETEEKQAITSHFGRHWFTTYWEHQGLDREYLKYMRGDTTSKDAIDDSDAVNDYIHTYYEDIKDRYLEEIFKLGL